MTNAELLEIEEELGFELPLFYRTTQLACVSRPAVAPQSRNPMLLDDPQEVLELNRGGIEMSGIGCPFFVGSDGGEKFYFVDATEPMSPVYCCEGEPDYHKIQAWSWSKYLTQIDNATGNSERKDAVQKRWWALR
jgi:hypothetical protein